MQTNRLLNNELKFLEALATKFGVSFITAPNRLTGYFTCDKDITDAIKEDIPEALQDKLWGENN